MCRKPHGRVYVLNVVSASFARIGVKLTGTPMSIMTNLAGDDSRLPTSVETTLSSLVRRLADRSVRLSWSRARSPAIVFLLRLSAVVPAVGCAHDRAPSPPVHAVVLPGAPPSTATAIVTGPPSPSQEPSAPSAAETEIYRSDGRTTDPHISNQVDAHQAGPVLRSLFPTHLTDLKRCPRPFFVPNTWSQIDQLQDKNMAAGRFVPVVEQRLDASFTAPGASESLFVIGIDNCQRNTIGHRVLAIFPAGVLTGSPKATLRWDEHDVDESRGPFVAILQKPGEPARLLDTSGHVVALNRDFVVGAPGGSPNERASQRGGPRTAPWRELERLTPPPGEGCYAFTVSLADADTEDAADGAAHQVVHVRPCRTP
jgi:hypothetical protein